MIDKSSDLIRALSIKTYKDTLTGTYNRRYYDEKRYLYDNIKDFPKKFGFIMLDVNDFKMVNDSYGHIHGDELLAKIGDILQENVESSQSKAIESGADIFIDRLTNQNDLVKAIMQLTGHDHGRRDLFDMDFVLDSIPGAVIVGIFKEKLPEVVYCSRGIHNIAGVESEKFPELLKQQGKKIIFYKDLKKVEDCFEHIINTHSRGDIIFRSHQVDGTINIYVSYFDITEQKKTQELKEDLRNAKLESKAKTDFMSNMSHDMRTPLNGILGLAHLMREKTDVDELHSMRLWLSMIFSTDCSPDP